MKASNTKQAIALARDIL